MKSKKTNLDFNGERFNRLRKQHKVSLHKMEEDLDISASTLCQLENGHNKNPKMRIIAKIARYFKVPVEYLIERKING